MNLFDNEIPKPICSHSIHKISFFCSISALYYDYPEITPHNFKGDFRYNKMNEKVVKFASQEVEARALIEGQFMAKRLHLEKIGYKIGKYYSLNTDAFFF